MMSDQYMQCTLYTYIDAHMMSDQYSNVVYTLHTYRHTYYGE